MLDPATPTWGTPGRRFVIVPACGHPRSVRWAVADGVETALTAQPRQTTCRRNTCPSMGRVQPIVDALWAS